MVNNHWVWYKSGKPFVPDEDKFGFVYIITNTKTTKAYVGCKQYYSMGKRKTKHKWEMYTGSSKYLNKDIEKIGKKYFTFEVIAEYKNKRSLRYYEMYYQVKWNVLTATIEGSDERAYYNSYVGGKFFPPIELYQDPDYKEMMRKKVYDNVKVLDKKRKSALKREENIEYKKKMRENNYDNLEVKKKLRDKNLGEKSSSALGPHKLTFEDGRLIVVPNLARWAMDSNKYDWAQLFHLKRGYKIQGGKKVRILKCKDIIKVEELNDSRNI
tara:strand:+ start:870 stop:1676 length:807 start_codon:yes stop_codon:yes gene_type:complete